MSPLYFDESGIHLLSKFIGFGILEVENPHQIEQKLKRILDKWHFSEEVKFWKISKLRTNIYQEWLDTYFHTNSHFYSLIAKRKDRQSQDIHKQSCLFSLPTCFLEQLEQYLRVGLN